jgi:hypothetical protein
MRKARFAMAALFALTVVSLQITAQEKPKPDSKVSGTTLKIQVVIAEHEGEKKLANLPYTFFLAASDDGHGAPWTKLRMGSRVPVATGSFQVGVGGGSPAGASSVNPLVNTQFQYIDVGTNIDARALAANEGRFDLTLNLERSWVEGEVIIPGEKQAGTTSDPNAGSFKQPIIRQFKTELTLPIRDGQTIQTTQAADPLSGRILTITVTMNVVK